MTNSTWNVSTSGDWSDASDWSGGVPNSSTATATIAKSGTYTVDIGSTETFSVGSITLNDTNATLEVDGKLDLAKTLTLTAGDLLLTGTISGGTINTGNGTFTVNGGTLSGVAIDGTIDMAGSASSTLTVSGGLTMAGAAGTGDGTVSLTGLYDSLNFSGSQKISSAIINIANDGETSIDPVGSASLTIGAAATIEHTGVGGYSGTVYLGSGGTGTIVNDGTITAEASVGYQLNVGFIIDPASFTNAGTVNVSDGDMLTFESASFANKGTINIDGTSTVVFDFETVVSQLGTIDTSSGATLDFSKSLNNVGTTFNVPTGAVLEGAINGGTIDGTITLASDLQNASQDVTLLGSPTLAGSGGTGAATINIVQEYDALCLSGTETIDNATINIGSLFYGSSIVVLGGGVVTLGSGITIVQASSGERAFLGSSTLLSGDGSIINDGKIDADANGDQFTINSQTFTNNGTISVTNGDTLYVAPTSQSSSAFSNAGTITVDGTSTLEYDVRVTPGQLGTVNAATGATLAFSELDNSGTTFVAPTGVNIEGTIDGGTLEGTVDLSVTGAQLDLSGVAMVGAGGSGPGTIDVTGPNSILNLMGTGTFSNATINVGSTLYYEPSNIYVSGTLASNVTIDQSAAGTYATIGGGGINEGTIDLASNGGTCIVSNGPFTNAGTIAISNGETLEIQTFIPNDPFTNNGTISVDGTSSIEYVYGVTTAELGTIVATNGGVLDFEGTLDNTGATFVVPAGATIEGIIKGGTIEGTLDVAYLPSLQFSVELTDSVTFEGQGGSGPGTIDLNGTLYLGGTETISDVTIDAGKGPLFITAESDVTFASNVTFNNVSIEIQPFQAVPVEGTVVSDGAIIANTNGYTLTIEIPNFTNAGTITVTNGDTLYLESTDGPNTFINTGTISVDGTSTLEVDETVTTAQWGTINVAPGATIELYGMLNNTGATFDMPTGTFVQGTVEGGTLEGNFNVTGNNPLQLSGTMTVANATIDVGAPSAAGAAIVNVGGGVVTIASSTTIEQTVTGTAAFLGDDANDPNAITSVGTVIVDGTIIAGVSGGAFGIDPATLTINGLLEADGGKIAVGSNDFTNLSGTALAGGSYEATSGGTFEFVVLTTFVTDDATIILNGSSAVMEQLNLNTNVLSTIETTLTSTGSGGTLEILGGRNWTQTTTFTNGGTIELGGGTFQVSALTSSGTIEGFGTVGEAVTNTGALVAQGGMLNVQNGSLSGYSGGTLTGVTLGAGANATLQLPSSVSITTLDGTIELLGASAMIQSSGVTVQSTLKTIGTSGALVVGDSYTSSNAISNAGTI